MRQNLSLKAVAPFLFLLSQYLRHCASQQTKAVEETLLGHFAFPRQELKTNSIGCILLRGCAWHKVFYDCLWCFSKHLLVIDILPPSPSPPLPFYYQCSPSCVASPRRALTSRSIWMTLEHGIYLTRHQMPYHYLCMTPIAFLLHTNFVNPFSKQ